MKRAWLGAALLLLTSCETSGIRDAYMSLDSSGKRKRERFFTDTEDIYCIAKVASGVDDVTVSATLRAEQIYDPQSGEPIDVDFFLGVGDEGPGKGEDITVSFQVERSDPDAPFTAGRFVCEIALDGEVKERLPYEVAFPACPEAPIFHGATCAGFVVEGSECPSAASTPCVCDSEGAWSCT